MNMTNRKISHHVKLEISVRIILALLAIGVMLNAVVPAVQSGAVDLDKISKYKRDTRAT